MKRAAHYVPRIGNQICEHIACGLSLREALKEIGYLAPSLPTVFKWLDQHADFREKYERARQLQADVHADQMLEISKTAIDHATNPKLVPGLKVAADILKWQAEVRNKGRYGKAIEESGRNKPLDPEKLRAEIKRLETELGVAESKVVPLKAVK